SAQEHLVFAVGIGPGDRLMFEDVFQYIVGLAAVVVVKKIALPAWRQVVERLKPESIPVDLDGRGRAAYVDDVQLFVLGPLEIELPELTMVIQAFSYFRIGLFMRRGEAPAIVVPGKRVFSRIVGRQGFAFEMADAVSCDGELHLIAGEFADG